MAQTIKIKRGGYGSIGSLGGTNAGEMALLTGSAGDITNFPEAFSILLANNGSSWDVPLAGVVTGSGAPGTLSDAKLNGILYFDTTNNKFYRLDAAGNQELDLAASTAGTLTDGAGIIDFTFDGGSDAVISVDSGSLAGDGLTTGGGKFVVQNADNTIGVAGGGISVTEENLDLSGNSTYDYDNLTSIPSGIVSASVLSSPSQGTVRLATNGVNNDVDTGLQQDDSPTFADLTLTGGDLIASTATTFNVFNTTATTVNAFGAATSIDIGAATGTTSINNNLDVDGDVNIDGGDLTTNQSTFNAINTNATTVNFAGAATALNIGASTGTATIRNATINLGEVAGDQVNIKGNLTVSGTTTTVNSETVTIADNIIQLNSDSDGITNGGLEVLTGAVTASLLYDVTNTWWETSDGSTARRVVSFADDAGSADVSFVYTDTNGYLAHIDAETPALTAGTLLQWNGSAMEASAIIDGGTY